MANPVIINLEPDLKSRGGAVARVAEVPRRGTGGVSEMAGSGSDILLSTLVIHLLFAN